MHQFAYADAYAELTRGTVCGFSTKCPHPPVNNLLSACRRKLKSEVRRCWLWCWPWNACAALACLCWPWPACVAIGLPMLTAACQCRPWPACVGPGLPVLACVGHAALSLCWSWPARVRGLALRWPWLIRIGPGLPVLPLSCLSSSSQQA